MYRMVMFYAKKSVVEKNKQDNDSNWPCDTLREEWGLLNETETEIMAMMAIMRECEKMRKDQRCRVR